MREALCTLLHKAGEIMLSAHGSGRVFTKPGDANYVTEYDIRVQRFLREELSRLLPEADFIGEEDEEKHGSESLRWIVDPIDGTTNFMHGLLESSVSAALCEGGDTLLGAVYQPYRDEFFFAEKGKGASLNREAIRVSGHAPEGALFTFGTTPYDRSSAGKTFRLLEAVFPFVADLRRSGSAAQDMAYVAAGRTDGFFEYRLSPWDFAAGKLLVTEAGGLASDLSGKALDVRAPSAVLCGGKELVERFLAVAEACGIDR
ncbi:MAG: inositol monophosphatase [Clostridia bacterium]|nr:inositol monophosphatase [Clostridia bacterium]